MSCIQAPVFQILQDINARHTDLKVSKYNGKALGTMDSMTLAAIQAAVSYDPVNDKEGSQEAIDRYSLKEVIVQCNVICVVVFMLAALLWGRIASGIIKSVDDATLTPSDYTLIFTNLPKETIYNDKIKPICQKVCPDAIEEDRIYMAKAFDDKIRQFRDLNTASKELRDLRTAEWRRMKTTFKETPEELKEELMSHNQVPRDATSCSNTSKYEAAFLKFKKTCEKCDEVEQAEEDGG